MTGLIGFLLAAAAIGLFAWSSYRVYRMVDTFRLKAFCTAFGSLALTMLFWAVVVATNKPSVTQAFMLASDCLLLLGTAAMALVLLKRFSPLVVTLIGGLVALTVAWRAFVHPAAAFIRDGLLYFNLDGSSRLLFVGLFAIIWLPAMMLVANRVADDPLLEGKRYSLQMYFVVLVALMAMFTKARREGAIIGLFAAIIFVFLLATVFNLALHKARDKSSKRRSLSHAPKRATAAK